MTILKIQNATYITTKAVQLYLLGRQFGTNTEHTGMQSLGIELLSADDFPGMQHDIHHILPAA